MIETWGEDMSEKGHGLITPRLWMFDDRCTGKFKIVETSNYHVIYQEVEKKRLIFFKKREYIPMHDLITYSYDKAEEILKNVEKVYKPILREKRLDNLLSK